jgi:hypothetical protein
MKPPPSQCACGARAIRTCGGCGTLICEEHQRIGVDRQGRKQYLCFPCDDERQHDSAPWQAKHAPPDLDT